MATRSRIAIETSDGSVESIYCHWDGYPDGVGATLIEHYKDHGKVQSLINLGDISSLGPKVKGSSSHSFDNPEGDTTVAYGRDRGEKGVDKRLHPSVVGFFKGDIEEWGYLFTQEGEWLVKSGWGSNDPTLLSNVLK